MLVTILVLIAVVTIGVYVLMQQPQFGALPEGARLERIKQSPNYKNGRFQNQHDTPRLTNGATYFSVIGEMLFSSNARKEPASVLPSDKTDLLSLNPNQNILVWFGHSSYFMQLDGKTFLIDPVFSGYASPLSFTNKSYAGSDIYAVDDLPTIDYLFISHDHYDHLDYETIIKLKSKVKQVVTGLGTGAHFEYWGYSPDIIKEGDWMDSIPLQEGFTVHVMPARHFSGRGLKEARSLWVSFVLQTPSTRLYLGGDSGYDTYFEAIGKQFGPFDLAILECGQYDTSWKHIHLMPEEIIQAAADLNAKQLLPVHWAKFTLANHTWDDPIIRATAAASTNGIPLVLPLIGEAVELDSIKGYENKWWEGL